MGIPHSPATTTRSSRGFEIAPAELAKHQRKHMMKHRPQGLQAASCFSAKGYQSNIRVYAWVFYKLDMKKSVIVISSILQFIAVVMYFLVLKIAISWKNGDENFAMVAIVALIAIFTQTISIQLKNKYRDEVEKAESIMQDPKTSYGWIALGVFGLAVLIVVIYVLVKK